MSKQRVTLSFTEDTIAEPVIHTMSQQFNLSVNICRADLAESGGWIEVEFDGDDKDIESGLAWAMSRGVRVDPAGGAT